MLTELARNSIPGSIPGPQRSATRQWTSIGRLGDPAAHTGKPEGLAAATLAVASAVSAAPLLRVFSGRGWVLPVLAAVASVHATGWTARRLSRGRGVAWWSLPLSLAVLALVATWTVLGSSTYYGLPDARTWSRMWSDLSGARSAIAVLAPPVPDSAGFTLMALWGAGAVAALGDWAAFQIRSTLTAALPPVAMFTVCSAIGHGPGTWAVVAESAALVAYLAAHTATTGRPNGMWLARERRGSPARAGLVIAITGVAAAWAVAPAASTLDRRGLLHLQGAGFGGGSLPRVVPNPIVDLHTRLVELSDIDVFTASSPVPSYWRLTSLNTFTGEDWISTYNYQAVRSRLPGVQAAPAGTRPISAKFTIESLDSVWLPTAFDPVAISGATDVSFDPSSDSLITPTAPPTGFGYTIDAYQYLTDLNPDLLNAAPPLSSRQLSSLKQYLALPSLPPQIYQLANQITAGATTEYQKAIDLQNFFLGPSFSYSLDPPDDGVGVDTLMNFLFVTRTGYCQQFAGSYAVLARAAGLPTRLAFGFTTGQSVGPGSYQVTDGDAHTWPEVYFGPGYGWLPFEPTKGFSDPAAAGYASNPQGSGNGQPSENARPAPHGAFQSPPTGTSSSPSSPTTSIPADKLPAPKRSGGGPSGWMVVLAIAGALLGWGFVNVGTRRARWWRRRQRAARTRERVLDDWQRASELLAWWGLGRQPFETDIELARRAAASLGPRVLGTAGASGGGDIIDRFSRLASQAAYGTIVPETSAREADAMLRDLHRRLLRAAGLRRLARWVLSPIPGWRLGEP
jgi:transglutaminase-like putative cysteine protease